MSDRVDVVFAGGPHDGTGDTVSLLRSPWLAADGEWHREPHVIAFEAPAGSGAEDVRYCWRGQAAADGRLVYEVMATAEWRGW